MALCQRGDGGDEFGQGSAECNEGQCDDGLGNTQSLCDEGAVIDQQVRADGDQDSTHDQQADVLAEGVFAALFLFFLGFGSVFHRQNVADDVGDEHCQQDETDGAAEVTGSVGDTSIDSSGHEEEQHRNTQALRVDLARADCDGDGGDQSGIADDRADGVAVGDLTVAGQG